MNGLKIRNAMVMGFAILTLVACGKQTVTTPITLESSPAATQTEEFNNDPYADVSTDAIATESDDPSAPEAVDEATSSTPAEEATPSPTPTIAPTPAPVAGSSKLGEITKSYPGIMSWERCEMTFQVRNPYFLKTLRERMVVTFTYKGQIVEVQEYSIELSPAIIKSYTIRSAQRADDGQVAIYAQ